MHWGKPINDDDVRDIIALPNGHLALTGTTNFGSHGQTDILFAEIDTAGTIIQQQAFGGSSYETGLSVKSLGSENFLLAGYTESFGQGFNDMYMIKTGAGILSCNAVNAGMQIVPMTFSKTNTLQQHPASLVLPAGGFTATPSTLPFQKLCTITNVPKNS
ncbi:MAG: hypothetical protein IPQ03_03020 [Bacteroidetes bacterium]|nr:hypothetical protein [Bacteroidota bacterium]